MISNKKKHGFSDIKVVLHRDGYGIRDYPKDHFDFIFDIGGNIGLFSIYARMLNPETKIVALEPCKETYGYMCKNLDGLDVETLQEALGNGDPLYFKDIKHLTGNMFLEDEDTAGGYEVTSMTLKQLFTKYRVDLKKHKVYLKLDCEGGEVHLMDTESTTIMKQLDHVGMEIHFAYKNPNFMHLPNWEQYVAWVENNFTKTHVVKYGNSNRSKSVGMYNIVKRIG